MQVQYTVKYTVHQSGGGCDPGGSRAAALRQRPAADLSFARRPDVFVPVVLKSDFCSEMKPEGLGKAASDSTSSRRW